MVKTQKSVKKNYLYNVTYQILSFLTPLITTPYISRRLGAGNIGISSYTASIVSYFTMFAALGINLYGQREIASAQGEKKLQSKVFWEIEIFRFITVSIAMIAFMGFVFIYRQYYLIFLAQSVLIVNVLLDITWFFQGNEDFKNVVLKNIIVKIIGIICIFVFVKGSDDLFLYVLIHTGSTVVGNIFLLFNLKGKIVRINHKELAPFSHLKTYIELFIPIIAVQVYNVLDKTMIGVITKSDVENGYYEQTTKIINLCIAIITALGPVLLPRAAAAYAQNDREQIKKNTDTAYRFIILLACPMCTGVIATAKYLVPWFFGPNYEKVSLLLSVYALVLMIIPLSNIAGYAVLNPTKQHNKSTVAICCGAVTNFLLNCLLIRHFASVGASIATVVAETVVTIVYFVFIKDYVSFNLIKKDIIRYFPASLGMGVIVFFAGKLLEDLMIKGPVITILQVSLGLLIYGIYICFVLKDSFVLDFISKIKIKIRH